MKSLTTIDLDALPQEALANLKLRRAARAVVFDGDGNVALLHVKNGGYYKLPGGGVEDGEDLATALKRECLEEIGCDIVVKGEVGMVVEYRGKYNIRQESYCYLADLVGAKGTPDFTEKEKAAGFEPLWVPLSEAIRLVSESNTEEYQGTFIIPRELAFLREAEKILSI